MMKFSERLRELREQAQMTQKQLAEKSGVQSRMIQRYEAGTSHPRISAVEKLAVALETSVDNLMGKTEQSFANFGEENGSKAERDLVAQAEKFSALFAGGDIPMEDKDAAFRIIMQAYSHATEIDKEKYTPKKYRKSSDR